jgi:hypothetical protein
MDLGTGTNGGPFRPKNIMATVNAHKAGLDWPL